MTDKDKPKNVDEYLRKYCQKHGVTVEEAKKHAMVKEYMKYALGKDNDNK